MPPSGLISYACLPTAYEAVTKLRLRTNLTRSHLLFVDRGPFDSVLKSCESGGEHLSAEQAHHPLQVVGDAGQRNFRTGAVHTT